MRTPIQWLRYRWILLLAALTPHCREVVRRASRQYEEPLSAWTRARLRVHFRICDYCERYFRQLELLHDASRQLGTREPGIPPSRLAAEAKERLKQRLRCERPGT